jgi:hypothetical protein
VLSLHSFISQFYYKFLHVGWCVFVLRALLIFGVVVIWWVVVTRRELVYKDVCFLIVGSVFFPSAVVCLLFFSLFTVALRSNISFFYGTFYHS